MHSRVRLGLGLSAAFALITALAVANWLLLLPKPLAFAGGHRVALARYEGPSPTGVPPALANASLLARGKYLTEAADCLACHTASGGAPFAGGRPFKLPFGTIYTPNITPDRETGIGRWTDAQFLRAVRQGVAADGQRLYPAFPYASYSLMPDDDVLAIKAYLFSLPQVRRETAPNTFAFPFNQRWLMAIWAAFFNPNERFSPVVDRSPQWNRGAYLVEGPAHCGECHTPRTLMQAMNTRRKFAGGAAEGWNAYNITPDRATGIGAWSQADIEAYLSKGHAPGRGVASGPMREAVELSFAKLAPSDIEAMAVYLRSVPAIRARQLSQPAGPAPNDHAQVATANLEGKRIFEEVCASCHAWSGAGALIAEAQLTGKRSVNDPTASNVALMVLEGAGPQTAARPYMPAFRAAYSDKEIAAVANYVTERFGVKPSRITAKDVGRLRDN